MDENEKQELQTSTATASSQFNKRPKFLKKTLQFLLPALSLLSFLLSASPPLSHFFQLWFHFQFSAFCWPLVGKIFERKFMFFICNGILAFLAKSLIFSSSSPPVVVLLSDVSTDHDEFAKTDAESTEPASSSEMEADELEDEETITQRTVTGSLEGYVTDRMEDEEEPGFKTKKAKASLNVQVPETNSPALMIGSPDDDGEQEESESLSPPISVEEEGNEVNVSTEELNRKFDEFIRKMKEEIRIGAQRHVIAV